MLLSSATWSSGNMGSLSEKTYQDRPAGLTIIDEEIIHVLMLKLSDILQQLALFVKVE